MRTQANEHLCPCSPIHKDYSLLTRAPNSSHSCLLCSAAWAVTTSSSNHWVFFPFLAHHPHLLTMNRVTSCLQYPRWNLTSCPHQRFDDGFIREFDLSYSLQGHNGFKFIVCLETETGPPNVDDLLWSMQ